MAYQKPSPISLLQEEFPCGIVVDNIGYRAKVVGYHVEARMLILEHETIGRWLADPYKCTIPIQKPVKPTVPVLM